MNDLLAAILRGETTDWPFASGEAESGFLHAASGHRVAPLVARQLRRAGVLAAWPESVRAALQRAAVQSAVVTALYGTELTRVLTAFTSAGITPLLFKGAGLAYTRYPHPCLRPRLDTDLLIRREDVPSAGQTLEALGYRRLEFVSGDLVSYQSPYARADSHGVQHVYDVHWKVANPQLFADVLSFDELEAEAVRVPALGEHARTVDDIPALLLACVHRLAHHNDSLDLLWLYDIHLLATGMDECRARRLGTLAADRRVRAVCARGLALARQYFHTSLPAGLLEQLTVPGDEASEAYVGGHSRRLDVLLSDLRALPDWPRRWRLLREHAFPPAAYMQASYGISSRALLPVLYVHRLARGAHRWLRPLANPHVDAR